MPDDLARLSSQRNYSPQDMFRELLASTRPRHQFEPGVDPARWRRDALADVLATLGPALPAVDPNPEQVAEWSDGEIVFSQWLIDVAPGLSALVRVNRPAVPGGEARPIIMCWSGHSPLGCGPTMSGPVTPEYRDWLDTVGTDFGIQMAIAGFCTFAVDWMGQGRLDDRRKPNHHNIGMNRDLCDVYYLQATALGFTSLAINLQIGCQALDMVCALPFVDPTRVGVMGESYGGTLSLWTSLTDARIAATELICYSDRFADFGYRDLNWCGSQATPGLAALVDVADLQGLLAPRPLLIQIATEDDCFLLESAVACQRRVTEIYGAAGASDFLEFVVMHGGHGWRSGASQNFFATHLQAPAGQQ